MKTAAVEQRLLTLEIFSDSGETVMYANGYMQIKVIVRGTRLAPLTEEDQNSLRLVDYSNPDKDLASIPGWTVSTVENEFSHALSNYTLKYEHPAPRQERLGTPFIREFWVSTTKTESRAVLARMVVNGVTYHTQAVEPNVGHSSLTLCGIPPIFYSKLNTRLEHFDVGDMNLSNPGIDFTLNVDQDNYYLSLDNGVIKKVVIDLPAPASNTVHRNDAPYSRVNHGLQASEFYVCDFSTTLLTCKFLYFDDTYTYHCEVNQQEGSCTLVRALITTTDYHGVDDQINWNPPMDNPQPFEVWDVYGNYGCFIADHDYDLNRFKPGSNANAGNNFVEYHNYRR